MCTDVVILRFTHPHFVLQQFGHRGDALTVTLHGDGIYIFGQQIIVLLFLEITLVVHQVVRGIQVLGLQAFPCILLCQADVFDVDKSLSRFVSLVQTIEDGETQGQPQTIGTIPPPGGPGMEPMLSLVSVGGKHPTPRQAE